MPETARAFPRPKRRPSPAFSLVEVTLALGILTFAVGALIGVFAVGARADRQSVKELEATHVFQSMVAVRRARPIADDTNDKTLILPRLDQAATKTVLVDRVGRVTTDPNLADFGLVYRVSPTTKTNGISNYSDVYCLVYWPPPVQPANAEGRVEFATRVPLPSPTPTP